MAGCERFTSRIFAPRAGNCFCSNIKRSKRRSMPCSSAAKQAGVWCNLVVARTSFTWPFSVSLMNWSNFVESFFGSVSFLSSVGISLRSTPARVIELSGFSLKSEITFTQKSSTESPSRMTSMPRSTKPSSCGFCFIISIELPVR